MAASASGPLAAIAAASSRAAATAPPGSATRLTSPTRVRALGGDRVAGQRQLHREAVRDPPRQPHQRAAGRHEPALDLRDAELGVARGDDQVARERDLEAAGDREALDRRDDRLAPAGAARSRRTRGSPTYGRSPATNAFRSMPAQKPSPAPVSTPTRSPSSPSSSSSAAATPSATAALTALRASGRLSVISRTPSRRSVEDRAACSARRHARTA